MDDRNKTDFKLFVQKMELLATTCKNEERRMDAIQALSIIALLLIDSEEKNNG